MTAQEIIESGLLELYALGQLEGAELQEVEVAIKQHSSVKAELRSIEEGLSKFAALMSVPADQSILDRTLEIINKSTGASTTEVSPKGTNLSMWTWLGPLSSVIAVIGLATAYMQYTKANNLQSEINKVNEDCEVIKQELDTQSDIYAAILDTDNRYIEVSPTDKYPETSLVIHTNEVDGQNYLQIKNLPEISDELAFQLWSLKGDSAPIPLTVFADNGDLIIPIDYEPGTDAYAITIEQAGGAESPNLAELIGVFSLS